MVIQASSTGEFLDQDNYLQRVDDMQLLTRYIFRNLVRNSGYIKQTAAVTAAPVQRHVDTLARHYGTEKKQKLLRYPAFPLEDTMTKFMKSVEPLLTKEELCKTKQMADEFLHTEGKCLQELLKQAAECENNWLAPRWLRGAYMQYRDPVTVYSSPGMTLPFQNFRTVDDYFCYAAKVIYGLVKFKEIIENNEIPIVKMGKYELDNSQFKRVFGTCRIPKKCEDVMEYHSNSKHAVVIYRNHFWKLNLYNNCDIPLHPDIIKEELQRICNAEKEPGCPIGLLTTDTRDNWAESYEELMKGFGNICGIRVIQKALFSVSLDDCVPVPKCEEYNVLAQQLIHGGGASQNSANRWMDKTIQLIINRNGMSGFNYEHSPAEGQPIAIMTDYVIQNLNNDKHYDNAAVDNYECARKLGLKGTENLEKHIKKAEKNIDSLADGLHMHVLHYKAYGSEFPKSQKLGPDSYLQIAMQFAFFRLHKAAAAHYESAHLRIYDGGRTETIRSCSNESIAFAKEMMRKDKVDINKRISLLRAAVNGHQEYAKSALLGCGVDRHLFGLKFMAVENNIDIPAFYKSPGFVKSTHFRLSTSQVASPNHVFMCYGPLTSDGYGCCYNPRKNDAIFSLSAWRKDPETSADLFAVALKEALDEMYILLTRAKL